jgi:hypothetical protein
LAYELSGSISDIFSEPKDKLFAFEIKALWSNHIEYVGLKSLALF